MDKQAFDAACERMIHQERKKNGIGTLGEKTIHAVVKNYMEENIEKHEQKVLGFVVDILSEEGIIEIQTGNFNKMRRKLKAFLEESPVMIVYPIPATKWISWIDEETGEITKKRKSPKKGSPYQAFIELYKIKQFLAHPNLSILLILMDVEESRLLNGWSKDRKKGSVRHDRIPVALVDEILIERVEDYRMLIPMSLGEQFTTKDYSKVTKLPRSQAQTALHIMNYLHIITRIGKQGNAFIYSLTED